MTDRRQAYEHRQSNVRAPVPVPVVPTQRELRVYVGDTVGDVLGLTKGDTPCDTYALRQRYFSEGGLTVFYLKASPTRHHEAPSVKSNSKQSG